MNYVYKWRFIFGGFRLGTQERGGLQTTGNRVSIEREVAWCFGLGGFHASTNFVIKSIRGSRNKEESTGEITFL